MPNWSFILKLQQKILVAGGWAVRSQNAYVYVTYKWILKTISLSPHYHCAYIMTVLQPYIIKNKLKYDLAITYNAYDVGQD